MPLYIMLPKASTYVKRYDGQTKWMYFLIEMMTYQKNIILFGIKLPNLQKKNEKEFDREPLYNKHFLKTKIKSPGDEVKDFYDKEIPKLDSNHTSLLGFCSQER